MFALGLFLGVCIGYVACAMMVVGKDADKQMEKIIAFEIAPSNLRAVITM